MFLKKTKLTTACSCIPLPPLELSLQETKIEVKNSRSSCVPGLDGGEWAQKQSVFPLCGIEDEHLDCSTRQFYSAAESSQGCRIPGAPKLTKSMRTTHPLPPVLNIHLLQLCFQATKHFQTKELYFADAKLKLGLLINTHLGFLRIEQNLEYVRKAQKLLKTSL